MSKYAISFGLKIRLQLAALALILLGAGLAQAATLSPNLQSQLASASDNTSVGVVIVAFHKPSSAALDESYLASRRRHYQGDYTDSAWNGRCCGDCRAGQGPCQSA